MLFRIFLVGLVVVAVAVQVVSTLDYNTPWIQALLNHRSTIVAAILGVVGLLLLRRLTISPGTLWYAIFAFYCFINLMAHGLIEYGVMILVWFGFTFVVFPSVLADVSQTQIARLMQFLLFFLGLFLVGLYAYATLYEIDLQWTTTASTTRVRFTSGLANPSIYSRITLTCAFVAGLLYWWKGSRVYLILGGIAVALLISTDVRADILAVVVMLGMYFIESKRSVIGKYVVWTIGAAVLFFGFFYLGFSYSDIDQLSSSRLAVWSIVIDRTYAQSPVLNFFVGTGHSVFGEGMHYDNTILEILCRYGITGLVLLFLGLNRTFARLREKCRHATTKRGLQTANWCKAGLYGVMTTSFFGLIVPSIGNAASLLLVPILIALAHAPHRRDYTAAMEPSRQH